MPLATLLLTGCIDNKYDFDGIDTTTELKVNNLVIPVNLDVVKLDDIITIDDDSKIKVVDGVYAVTEEGDFHSDRINIPSFTAPAPSVPSVQAEFRHPDANGSKVRRAASDVNLTYPLISTSAQEVRFTATGIDKSIMSIQAVECRPLSVNITLQAAGLGSYADLGFKNLAFKFLKGLTLTNLPEGASYDAATGNLVIPSLDCNSATKQAVINLTVSEIDFATAGVALDYDSHTLSYDSEIELSQGQLDLTFHPDLAQGADVPDNIGVNIATEVAALEATSFSGDINYMLEGNGLNISPVDLSDIPDFLSQEDTDLKLANPQIYLELNNPLGDDKLRCQTGLTLTAVRGENKNSFSLDNNGLVVIGYDRGFGPYDFVLSPYMPENPDAAFGYSLTHVLFSGLSNVLSGNGIPNQIEIHLDNPQVPAQHVDKFQLGTELEGITGKYKFFAPLALKGGDNGSVIVYRDRKKWDNEDVQKITIEVLELEADVTSTIPLGAVLTATPIDRDGNPMNVTVEGADISANAVNQHILLRTTGEIKGLDGISFEAVVRPGNDDQAIGPDQTITLTNIRARVTGNYTTDF